MKKGMSNINITRAAIIAALYAALTLAMSPISYGVMQVRPSEAMIVLAAICPEAVPGLTAGCFIADILGPNGLTDAVFGSIATFIGAWCAAKLRDHRLLLPLPNVVANGIIVGGMIKSVYGAELPLAVVMGWVALGEFISSWCLGLPLLLFLNKRKGDLKL